MPKWISVRFAVGVMALISASTATGDTVTHFRPSNTTGVYADVRTLLDLVGIGRTNVGSETVATYFTVPGETGNVDLTFTFRRDTGVYQFTFGFYPVSAVTADPFTDKTNYAIQALTAGTQVFDDRVVNPPAAATFSVPAGSELGFWLVPNALRSTILANPQTFFSTPGQRLPLFSVSDANPGQFDQMLSFVGNGVTLFTFEDQTRAGTSDQDFTDVAFTISTALIPTFPRPTITVLGADPFTLEYGESFVDPGATAVDARGLDITSRIGTLSTVNALEVGQYSVTYSVVDDFGAGDSEVRRVAVVDTAPPVLTPNGTDPIVVPQGGIFVDPGCGCSDNADGDLGANVVVDNPVDVNVPGIYVITYTCSDFSLNAGTPVTRTVVVEAPALDLTPPVITLIGSTTITLPLGGPFNDPGATCLDDTDGDISGSVVVDNPVNTGVPGTYIVTYTCFDSSGNPAAPVTRTVVIEAAPPDLTPPVITLIGATVITVPFGGPYFDPGATCADDVDGDISANIVVGNPVDVNTPGTYVVAYTCSDASGNPAVQVTRTVIVQAPADGTPPVITRLGAATIYVPFGTVYTDPGATCLDDVDGNITAQIVVDNPVNTGIAGTYTVTYTCSDSAGNPAAAVTRTVIVSPAGGNVCDEFQDALRYEWSPFAHAFGYQSNTVCVPFHRIPERWALALVGCVLCNDRHPRHARTLAAYQHNLDALANEPEAVVGQVDPYRHLLAGLLLLNTRRQVFFKELFGLTLDYEIARRAGRDADPEVFADDGDLDEDGITNADEFDIVFARGGDIDDFVEEAALRGAPPVALGRGWLGVILVSLLLCVASEVIRRHNRGRPVRRL